MLVSDENLLVRRCVFSVFARLGAVGERNSPKTGLSYLQRTPLAQIANYVDRKKQHANEQ